MVESHDESIAVTKMYARMPTSSSRCSDSIHAVGHFPMRREITRLHSASPTRDDNAIVMAHRNDGRGVDWESPQSTRICRLLLTTSSPASDRLGPKSNWSALCVTSYL